MKKVYLFLFLGTVTFAQPVVTSADIVGYSATLYYGSANGYGPGNAGENQTWDYANVSYSPEVFATVQSVPLSTVPFASAFPDANFAEKFYRHFDDNSEYLRYSVYYLSDTGIEALGSTSESGVLSSRIDSQMFVLPQTYGLSSTDTSQYDDDLTYVTTTDTFYDSYGTLITPIGTYENALRIKRIFTRNNQVHITYSWYLTNPFRPLASACFDPEDFNFGFRFYENAPLIKNTFALEHKLELCPNPVTSILYLTTQERFDRISIVDVLGHVVLMQNENTNHIDVSDLSSGIYILVAFSGELTYQQKFIKQ